MACWPKSLLVALLALLAVSTASQLCTEAPENPEAVGVGASLLQLRTAGRHLESEASEDLRSRIECKDTPGYNQTCLIRNAYLETASGDRVTLLVLKDDELPTIQLSTWGAPALAKPFYVRRFATLEDLRTAAERLKPERKRGLSLLFTAHWMFNWAHAIFDGLYPAFTALAKFQRHKDPFLPIFYNTEPHMLDCRNKTTQAENMTCAMEEAFRVFGSIGDEQAEMVTIRSKKAAPDGETKWLLLEELVVGNGHGGEYVSSVSLPASQSFEFLAHDEDVLLLFRERLYQSHGVVPPPRRRHSNEGRDPNKPLKVLVTDNERHTSKLLKTISETAASFNKQNAAADMRNRSASRLEVSYVSWTKVQPWGKQLNVLRDVDILVSGIGSALFYSLLLPDGAATVNLGWGRPRGSWGGVSLSRSSSGANISVLPSYGEEFLGMSNRRAKMFYLPLEQVRRGPETSELTSLLMQVEQSVRNGFEIPLASPEQNLGIFGKIMLELQRRSEVSHRGLLGLPQVLLLDSTRQHYNRSDLLLAAQEEISCHTRATGQAAAADVVYEQNFSSRAYSVMGAELTKPCHIDVKLLRQLKVEYGLKEALGVTAECECIVCEQCGFH